MYLNCDKKFDMQIVPLLQKELQEESTITRKMLTRVPDDKFDWKPHEKSMTLRQLTGHIGELPSWITMALTTSEIDFATAGYTSPNINSQAELLELFEKSLQKGEESLKNCSEEDLQPNWTLRTGEHVHMVMTKYEVIRHSLAQTIHHRAQLGVYLRLLSIPIPGSYGPSADEQDF